MLVASEYKHETRPSHQSEKPARRPSKPDNRDLACSAYGAGPIYRVKPPPASYDLPPLPANSDKAGWRGLVGGVTETSVWRGGSRKMLKSAAGRVKDFLNWNPLPATVCPIFQSPRQENFLGPPRHPSLPGLEYSILVESFAHQPYHGRVPLDEQAALLVALSRRKSLTKRGRKPVLDPTNLVDAGKGIRHPLTCCLPCTPPPDPSPSVNGEFLAELFNTLSQDKISRSHASLSDQDTPPTISRRLSPAKSHNALDTLTKQPELSNVIYHTLALGFLRVTPYSIELFSLDGGSDKLVKMAARHKTPASTRSRIIAAKVSTCLGLGRVVIVLTELFEVYAFRVDGLVLLSRFKFDSYEKAWQKYTALRARRPIPDTQHRPLTMWCPSTTANDSGVLFLGTSSGTVHVWRLATRDFECILPSPSPVGSPMPVVSIVFQCVESPGTDEDLDVAFQAFVSDFQGEKVEGVKPVRTRHLIWVFYGDGRGTLWESDGCHKAYPGYRDSYHDLPLRCADLSGRLERCFAPIDEGVITTSSLVRILDIFDWSGPALGAALRRLGKSVASAFPSFAVSIVSPITLRNSAVVLLLVSLKRPLASSSRSSESQGGTHSSDDASEDECDASTSTPHAILSLLPFTNQECPAIDFVPLSTLGVREVPDRPYLCTRAELSLQGILSETDKRQDCIVIEHSGVIYAIYVEISREAVHPNQPPRVILSLIGSHLLRTKDKFTSMVYEKTFDELILGTDVGELICIPRLSQQLFIFD